MPGKCFRKSIALYYYTEAKNDVRAVATNYRARPKDKAFNRLLIFVDKKLISIFHFLKTKFNISDRLFTQFVDLLSLIKKTIKKK